MEDPRAYVDLLVRQKIGLVKRREKEKGSHAVFNFEFSDFNRRAACDRQSGNDLTIPIFVRGEPGTPKNLALIMCIFNIICQMKSI